MSTTPHFVDRYDAGARLGIALREHAMDRPLIVLGLPRGGVPVAARVAEELNAPLDIFVVRKLGVPDHDELAFGAIASGNARLLNHDVIEHFDISPNEIERVAAREQHELQRREQMYRGAQRFPVIGGETVVLVDDGAATGASMRVAISALRQLGPRSIVAAVPVGSRDALQLLSSEADACTCIIAPEPFYGVGLWYRDFSQVSDVEVRVLLGDARHRWQNGGPLHAGARF